MTIFLTTQYLEEADVLADRVGIIDDGRIVAEGTPTELKRARRHRPRDRHARQGDAPDVRAALATLPGVLDVDVHGNEAGDLVAERVGRGRAPSSSPCAAPAPTVRELTLRTPTLDDVFLELTGTRIEADEERRLEREEVPAMTTTIDQVVGRQQRPSVPAPRASSPTPSPSPAGRCGRSPATSKRSSPACSSPCSSSS